MVRINSFNSPKAIGPLSSIVLAPNSFSKYLGEEGVRELVIYRPGPNEQDRNELGSTFFVAKDSKINTLAGMKGKRFIANDPNAFYSYVAPLGEISYAGYDPSAFFVPFIFNTNGRLSQKQLGNAATSALPSFNALNKSSGRLY